MIDSPDVLVTPPPELTNMQAQELAERIFGITGPATSLDSERDQNFRIDDDRRGRFLLKVSNAAEPPVVIECETEALLHIERTDPSLPIVRPCPTGDGPFWATLPGPDGSTHFVRLFTFLEGRHVEARSLDEGALFGLGATLAHLGRALRGFFHPGAGRRLLWDEKHAADLRPLVSDISDGSRRALVTKALDEFEANVLPVLPSLRAQAIHNDLSLDNALFDGDGRITGIVDFGDLAHTALVCDLSTTMASVLSGRNDPFDAAESLLTGYGSVTPLEAQEVAMLPGLLAARLSALVAIASWRAGNFPANEAYITDLVDDASDLLSWLEGVEFEEVARRFMEAAPLNRDPVRLSVSASKRDAASGTEELIARRRRVLGSALSPLSYDRPLHLVRGEGPWLFDADGRRYLDAYNNVPVVGHGHPRVTEAIAEQARALNTNLRYIHENAVELAERLCASMPDELDTCMFVNSGSEANDLAWRLATEVAGGSGGIVTDHAYHGVTSITADLSPELWSNDRRPRHVETIPAPDGYAGVHRREDERWAEVCAAHLDAAVEILSGRNVPPAAVYHDAGFTSDGILTPPVSYVHDVARRAKAAGALLVADEVQSGLGRFGERLWGFQSFDVVPDIVTIGKPMGNGHPVAAVVTRTDIVDRFARSTEFFSTFGGNPVACAAGLAVLDVIDDERLIRRAARTGKELLSRLEQLQGAHPSIGEVRGRGLLVGVALVRDNVTRTPDSSLAEQVLNGMRERGVLVGTSGPHSNVLKIRPPLAFQLEHVEAAAVALDEALDEAERRGG